MEQEIKITSGLRETPHDERDFKLGAVFDLPTLESLPSEFELGQTTIRDQTTIDPSNDKCSEYGYGVIDELQEGVLTNPDYSFAVSKDISGDPEVFGQDLRTAGLGHVNIGAIEQSQVPAGINVEDHKYRYLESWPTDLKDKASNHKKKSLWVVTGPYDSFDNIRATIYKFFLDGQQNPVVFGCKFGWSIYQIYMDTITSTGSGHAMAIKGWVVRNGKTYLKVQQSVGEKAGENGYHFFSREVINDAYEKYKAFTAIDMPREDAEWMLKHGIKENDSNLLQFYKVTVSYLKDVINYLLILKPTPQQVSEESLKITLYQKIFSLLIRILLIKKKPMTYLEATIQVESGGDDNAIGDKNLTNHAYGCLQIRQGVCDTVNTHYGTTYKAQDCLGNRQVSIDIWNKYWPLFPALVTDEDKAKAWNGGPGWKLYYGKQGYEKYTANLDIYWSKINKYLNQ